MCTRVGEGIPVKEALDYWAEGEGGRGVLIRGKQFLGVFQRGGKIVDS